MIGWRKWYGLLICAWLAKECGDVVYVCMALGFVWMWKKIGDKENGKKEMRKKDIFFPCVGWKEKKGRKKIGEKAFSLVWWERKIGTKNS